MNRKKRVALILAIIGIIISSCVYVTRKQAIRDFVNYENIDMIHIVNGSTGEMVDIVDTDSLFKIEKYLKGLSVKRTIKIPSSGYSYYIDLYNGDQIETRIMFHGKYVDIDDNRYSLTNYNEESPEDFLQLYKK